MNYNMSMEIATLRFITGVKKEKYRKRTKKFNWIGQEVNPYNQNDPRFNPKFTKDRHYQKCFWDCVREESYTLYRPIGKKSKKISLANYRTTAKHVSESDAWTSPFETTEQICQFQEYFFENVDTDALDSILSIRSWLDFQIFWKCEVFVEDNEYSTYYLAYLLCILGAYAYHWFDVEELIWEEHLEGVSPVFRVLMRQFKKQLNEKKSRPIAFAIVFLMLLTYCYWLDPTTGDSNWEEDIGEIIESNTKQLMTYDKRNFRRDDLNFWAYRFHEYFEDKKYSLIYWVHMHDWIYYLKEMLDDEFHELSELYQIYAAYTIEYNSRALGEIFTQYPGMDYQLALGSFDIINDQGPRNMPAVPWKTKMGYLNVMNHDVEQYFDFFNINMTEIDFWDMEWEEFSIAYDMSYGPKAYSGFMRPYWEIIRAEQKSKGNIGPHDEINWSPLLGEDSVPWYNSYSLDAVFYEYNANWPLVASIPKYPYDLYMRLNYLMVHEDMSLLDRYNSPLLKKLEWKFGEPGCKVGNPEEGIYIKLVKGWRSAYNDKEFIAWLDSYTLDPKGRHSNYQMILRGPITARIKRYCIYGF